MKMSLYKTTSVLKVVRRSMHLCKLENRGLIAVSGKDAGSFLQGLITNDVQLLTDTKSPAVVPAFYSLMLNVQGRVVNDFVVYFLKNPTASFQDNTFLLDTDASLVNQTIALFQKYRLRRKLEITDVSDKCSQFSLWNFQYPKKLKELKLKSEEIIFFDDDPRLGSLGKRLLLPSAAAETTLDQIAVGLGELVVGDVLSQDQWKVRRYQAGVPEGSEELPPGQCLPLESNCDFLNGVSFSKGCYVGQELTARTHNVGVTRKRLLPVKLEGSKVKPGDKLFVESPKGFKPAGEIRAVCGGDGLALVRLQYLSPSSADSAKLCVVAGENQNSISAIAHPSWPGWFPPLKSILDKIM